MEPIKKRIPYIENGRLNYREYSTNKTPDPIKPNNVFQDKSIYLPADRLAKKESTNKVNPNPTAAEIYRGISNDPTAGLVYDTVNAGLYLAAPFTAGATLPLAYGMTALQGAGAIADIAENGVNFTNGLDAASLVPGFGISAKIAKKSGINLLANISNKSTKYVKRANNYLPIHQTAYVTDGVSISRTIPSLLQYSFKNKGKYLPYTIPILGEDVANHAMNVSQIINDTQSMKLIPRNKKGGSSKNWIQDAVNPKHKGYCTPMTKATCTPRRKALARTFKKMAKSRKHESGGLLDFIQPLIDKFKSGGKLK